MKLLFENGADPDKAPHVLDDNSEMSVLLKSHGVPSEDINALDNMDGPHLYMRAEATKENIRTRF